MKEIIRGRLALFAAVATGAVARVVRGVAGEVRFIAAAAAMVAIGVGLWMAWAPLGLIVPGTVVFALVVYGELRRLERGRRQ